METRFAVALVLTTVLITGAFVFVATSAYDNKPITNLTTVNMPTVSAAPNQSCIVVWQSTQQTDGTNEFLWQCNGTSPVVAALVDNGATAPYEYCLVVIHDEINGGTNGVPTIATSCWAGNS